LLIGGYALAAHGYVRATNHLDVWVGRDRVNAERAGQALRDFGLSVGQEAIEALMQENHILRMGVPPLRIELLTSISGVDFEDCYARQILVDIGELRVPLISLEDLKTNKRSSGRMKDLADLEELEG
jgi:hypothetical protein